MPNIIINITNTLSTFRSRSDLIQPSTTQFTIAAKLTETRLRGVCHSHKTRRVMQIMEEH